MIRTHLASGVAIFLAGAAAATTVAFVQANDLKTALMFATFGAVFVILSAIDVQRKR